MDISTSEISGWEGEELSLLGPALLSAHVKVNLDDGTTADRVIFLFQTCIILLSVNQSLVYHYQV